MTITGTMKRTFDATVIEVSNEPTPRRVRSMDPITMIATDNVGWQWKVPHCSPAQREAGVAVTWLPGNACGMSDGVARLIAEAAAK